MALSDEGNLSLLSGCLQSPLLHVSKDPPAEPVGLGGQSVDSPQAVGGSPQIPQERPNRHFWALLANHLGPEKSVHLPALALFPRAPLCGLLQTTGRPHVACGFPVAASHRALSGPATQGSPTTGTGTPIHSQTQKSHQPDFVMLLSGPSPEASSRTTAAHKPTRRAQTSLSQPGDQSPVPYSGLRSGCHRQPLGGQPPSGPHRCLSGYSENPLTLMPESLTTILPPQGLGGQAGGGAGNARGCRVPAREDRVGLRGLEREPRVVR